jgi:hypothetical protein
MARASNGKKLLIVANVLFILGLAGVSTYLFVQNRDLNDQLTLTTEEKNRRLVEEINKVFDLPEEEPVVAVVTDSNEFKAQYAAFDNAEEGDYLLFYRKARLNVLYRQDEKRVVKTANVVVPISIELVGSEEAIAEAEAKLADFGDQITIVKKVDDTVKQAFVFDVDSDQAAELESIAELLGYEVGSTLPASIVPGDQTEIIIAVVASETPSSPELTQEP